MVGTSTFNSSSSSSGSFTSFDDVSDKSASSRSGGCAVKFLCSYGGRILPRYPDGKLRYVGGDTRVLSVDRSLPFSEIEAKMKELCGWEAVSVRCQLPTEDLDALVSVTSDEDLMNLLEEYDVASRDRLKIRAFLLPKSLSPPSTPPISATAAVSGKSAVQHQHVQALRAPPPADLRCLHQVSGRAERIGHGHHHHHHHHHHHPFHGESRPHQFLVHHANNWH